MLLKLRPTLLLKINFIKRRYIMINSTIAVSLAIFLGIWGLVGMVIIADEKSH